MIKPEWDFPLNVGGGQYEGLNNPGVESFKGNLWESLAREIIQNSTDARRKNAIGPVIVNFQLEKIPTHCFPGARDLKKIFSSCRTFPKTSEKAKKFFDRAIDILNEDTINILKISDYNTTGLRGVDKDIGSSDWNNLINGTGSSDKKAASGGSFGIGKNAPFACSLLRTVFYGTKNIDGETGFEGVAQLASHFNELKEETRGTGFYRFKETYKAIGDMRSYNKIFHRNEIGTDVFVAGVTGVDTWIKSLIKAVIENFFVAIHEGRLEVLVEKEKINKATLPRIIDSYILNDKSSLSNEYYKALVSAPVIIEEFEELGRIELYIEKNNGFSKKIAMVRETGMKITHMDRFSGAFKFSGVMIARGEKLNEFLRQCEPPTHDNWEPSRYDDREAYARRTLQKLKQFIRNKVRELNKIDESETADLEGLSQFLPDQPEAQAAYEIINPKHEEYTNIPKNAKLIIKQMKMRPFLDGIPNAISTNIPKSKSANSKKSVTSGNESPRERTKDKFVKLGRIRAFCTDFSSGLYQIICFPESDGIGYIQIKVVGEDAKSYFEPISKVYLKDSNEELCILDDSKVGPVNFKKGEKQSLIIKFTDEIRYALEVSVHEN